MAKSPEFNNKAKNSTRNSTRWRPEIEDRFLDEVEAGHAPYVQQMLGKYPKLAHAVRLYDKNDNYSEKSALHIAAMEGHARIIQILLDAGTPVDTKDTNGETPLMDAATDGRDAALQLLLKAHAHHSSKGEKGVTPLMRSALHNNPACAKALMRAGARPNLPDDHGETALHYAVYGAIKLEDQPEQYDVIRALLEKGANPDITDNEGFTPANRARSEGKRDLANFIEDYALQVYEMNEMEAQAREQKALDVLRHGSIKVITTRRPIQLRK